MKYSPLPLALLAACAEAPEPPRGSIELRVTEARDAGSRATTVPWSSGGRFTANVAVVAPRFVGPIPARVSLVNDRAPDAGSAPQSVVLTQLMPASDRHAAPVPLAWPAGGAVRVRVEAVGLVEDFEVTLDVPRVGLSNAVTEQAPAAGSTLRRFALCFETNAREGSLVVQGRRGRFAGDAEQVTLPLEQGSCVQGAPLFPSEVERSRATVQVSAETRDFLVTARLDGTAMAAEFPVR